MNYNRKAHFEVSERKFFLRIIDVLLVVLTLFAVGQVFDLHYFKETTNDFVAISIFIFYFQFIGSVFDLYNLQVSSTLHLVTRSVILSAITLGVLFLATPYFTPVLPSDRLQIVYFFLSILLPLLSWRYFYLFFLTKNYRYSKRSILIAKSKLVKDLVMPFEVADPHHQIIGYYSSEKEDKKIFVEGITPLHSQKELIEFIYEEGIYEIIIGPDVNISGLHPTLLLFLEKGIVINDYITAMEISARKIPVLLAQENFYLHFPLSRSNHNKLYLIAESFTMYLFAIVGLALSLFVLPFVLLGNLLGNRGPLFYKQERVGKNGKPFQIIKLRTMVTDAEKNGAVFAKKNDARITPFGNFLRKTRIDEIPQLLNILKGEMSLIGPRPERQVFVEQITEEMPLYPVRHAIKPGLTGWAQINYRYGASIDDSIEKLRYDLYYIKNRNIFLDIEILIKTISTVVFFRGQ